MSKKIFFIVISAVFMFLGCGNDSCTTTHSYGINSLTRKDAAQTCYEKITNSHCYDKNYTSEQIKDMIQSWQNKNFIFHKDSCSDLNDSNKTLECPDFIPEFLKFSKVVGCEIYTVDPHTKCDAPCYDLYFSTNDKYFQKASFREFGEKYIDSVSSDGLISFYSTIEINGSTTTAFSWSEKAEDGTEIQKGVHIWMEIVDSNIVEEEPVPEEEEE